MQETKPHYLHMMVVLLGCAIPGLALSAPPNAPAPKPIVKPEAWQDSALKRMEPTQAKAKAKAGQSQGGKKAPLQSEDASKQPYQPLVDAVRKSTDAFREENVSESGERDRLQDPPR